MPLYEASFSLSVKRIFAIRFHCQLMNTVASTQRISILISELFADKFSCTIQLRTKHFLGDPQMLCSFFLCHFFDTDRLDDLIPAFVLLSHSRQNLFFESLLMQPFNDLLCIILRTDMYLYFRCINVLKSLSSLDPSEIIDDLVFATGKQPRFYHLFRNRIHMLIIFHEYLLHTFL